MSREWFEDPVVLKIKRVVLKSGNNGIRELISAFRSFNTDKDAKLSPKEFEQGLKSRGVTLTPIDLKHLIHAFDRDGDGFVSLTEFVAGFNSGLPHRRRTVLDGIFAHFDSDGDGNIPLAEFQQRYDPYSHPAVVRGEMGVDEAAENFFSFFNEGTNPEGLVSKEEFFTYYAGVSSNIEDDDYFEDVVTCVWGLAVPDDPPDTSFGSVLNAKSRGKTQGSLLNTTTTSGQRPPAASAKLQQCYATLTKQPANRTYNTTHLQSKRSSGPAPQVGAAQLTNYESSYNAAFKAPDGKDWAMARPARVGVDEVVDVAPLQSVNQVTPTGIPIVDKVRTKIFERGGSSGFRGLTRVLRIMDDNGNKALDRYELQNGLQMYGLTLTKDEMDHVMRFFDRDGSGSVSVGEFVRSIRGGMSRQRQELVMMAYQLLDVNGDQTVTFGEIKRLYDTSKHPDVVSKSKTQQQVLQEFIKGWDKDSDGTVSWEEFLDYYSDISAGIDSDQYFELMLRNAWHISGGTGAAANTSCRRVLVVFNDGAQKIMEIKNDLGIGPKDTDLMRQNLEAQGVSGIKRIELAF